MVRRSVSRSLDDDAPIEDQVALVRDMLAGSRRAWRTFHARYHALVVRMIEKVTTRHVTRTSAEDVHEIYATLCLRLCADGMGKLRSFDGERRCTLGTWIGVLAIHCAHDHLRALRHAPAQEALGADDILDDAPTPEEALDRKEQLALAAAVIRELPAREREFVALHFDEGLDEQEVAARMRISVSTVYSKKHKIRSRIEARLAEPGAERLAA
jgi:RNA polymerase sigma-70 factor (ECF subfamily)